MTTSNKKSVKKSSNKIVSTKGSSVKSSVKKKLTSAPAKTLVKTPAKKSSSTANDDFGIASLILGVASILPFFGLNLVAGILGIVFGYKQKNISESKTAKTGIILSIIGLSLWVVIYIIVLIALVSFISLFAYTVV